ncbi:MAG: hypothetical protein WC321_06425, partial [Candidatus Omnitrophota bacterium]
MKKEGIGIVILQLFIIILTGLLIYVFFREGVEYENVRLVAVLITTSIFLLLAFEIRQRRIAVINGKSVVLFALLFWLLLDPLMLREGIEQFWGGVVLQVFLMIILFLIMFYIGYLIQWPQFFIKIFRQLDYGSSFNAGRLSRYAKISFCLGFLPLIIWGGGWRNIIYTLTHGGRWAAWARAAYGEWEDYLKALLGYFNQLGVQLVIFYSFFIRKKLTLLLLAGLGLWIIFNSGTRSALGAAILPAFILYYLDAFNKKKRVRYRLLLWVLILLGIMQFQLLIRNAPA